jgi:hypothetical protein
MQKIKIFNREVEDGVSDSVSSQASIAYCSPVLLSKKEDTDLSLSAIIASSDSKSLGENTALYYLESVLVSTNWNGNDDVFIADSTWAARDTPVDKQFNFMHDENDIIGHIISSHVIDGEGNSVANDILEPPSNFDIITRAVLYNSWTDPENKIRMENIIAEIKEGKWFVSMECSFAGFDYSVIDPNGDQHLVARDSESAFLTKHLRAYGGTGEYEGYKVGRALRDISFSGKGLVSNPANPRSIILNSKSIAFSVDSSSFIGDLKMSDSKVLEEQISEIKSELTQANETIEELKAEAAKVEALSSDIETLEASVKEKEEIIAGLEEKISTSETEVSELTASLEASKTELTASKDEVKKRDEELDEVKKREKDNKRKAALIEAGMESSDAEANLASFEALDDEAFDAVISLYATKNTVVAEEATSTEEADETQASEETEEAIETPEEVFEDVVSEDATLVVAEKDEATEAMSARAELSDWISGRLNK